MNIWQQFDHLGIVAFSFFAIDAVLDIRNECATWRTYVRLVVALLGLAVDLYLVFVY